MRRRELTHVPLILAIVAVIAMVALVQDRNVRTWATVMGLTSVAAVGYAAYQEQRATRAVSIARRRLGGAPYDELRREMDRARRHERPFSLVRIRATDVRSLGASVHGQGTPALRSTDRFWKRGADLYLLLPETSSPGVDTVLRRALSDPLEVAEDWRVASFPADGVTVGALFAALGAPAPRGEDLVRHDEVMRPADALIGVPVVQTYEEPPNHTRL